MSSKTILISVLLTLLPASFLFSQEETFSSLDELVEEIASSSDVELDYTALFQSLENLYYNPLDLNSATEEEFSELMFLTEFQIFSLVKYRKKFGNYSTLYELQYVDGIDPVTLKRLLPFVTISDKNALPRTNLEKAFTYGRHTTLLRYQRLLQDKAGYEDLPDSVLIADPDKSRYLGSPDKLYFKYNYQYKDKLFYGVTMEKDDGEQFFNGAQKYGFDFYSGHFQINELGIIKKLVVGDFSAQFGQGLTMWSGMGYGKTSSATNIIKKPRGINKYSSVNESAFFRGEAVSLQYKNLVFTEFVSYKSLDGSVDTADNTDLEDEQFVSSFLESGYHRTPSEIAKRSTIKEFVTGGNLSWYTQRLRIGATGIYYNFSEPLGENPEAYRYFDFTGNSNFNLGVDYLLNIRKVNFFGETSMSQNLGYATVNGAVVDFVPEFKMSIVHRYYRPDYQALYAQPFSEGNKPYNESGIFIGAEVFPKKYWKVEAYIDSWKYPWLRYGVGGPSKGTEYLLQVTHYPQRNLEMYLRVKYETKQKNDSDIETGIRPLIAYSSSKYRYHISYSASTEWKIKSRIEISRYNVTDQENNWGYMVYQDIQYKPENLPLTFTARFAVFETSAYETRIYAYEPDILYGFSVPAYYGQGTRLLLVIKYSILDNLDCWFRIANTYYNDQQDLGTGLDAIEGNNRTDIKLQFRYQF